MEFPIEKCQVVWRKGVSSDNDRQAIIEDLKKMALELQEAIDFTVKLDNVRMLIYTLIQLITNSCN